MRHKTIKKTEQKVGNFFVIVFCWTFSFVKKRLGCDERVVSFLDWWSDRNEKALAGWVCPDPVEKKIKKRVLRSFFLSVKFIKVFLPVQLEWGLGLAHVWVRCE